jgi:type VI secretion system Hcp family effector
MSHPVLVRLNGSLKGTSPAKGGSPPSALLQAELGVGTPRDPASGQVSGKRVHKPVIIITPNSVLSPELTHAYLTKKALDAVILELDDPKSSRTGSEGSKHTLRGVVVTRIAKYVGLPPHHRGALDTTEWVEVEMTFRKIDVKFNPGGKSATDNWGSRN